MSMRSKCVLQILHIVDQTRGFRKNHNAIDISSGSMEIDMQNWNVAELVDANGGGELFGCKRWKRSK